MANHPFTPTATHRAVVEAMCAYGAPHADIALMITNPENKNKPISLVTLRKHFKIELALGKIKAHAAVANTLFKLATGGGDWRKADVQAAKWYSISQMGWRSPPHVIEHTGKGGERLEYPDLSKLADDQIAQLRSLLLAAGVVAADSVGEGGSGDPATRH